MVSSASNMPQMTLAPKFVFGMEGNLKNSMFIYDEKKLVYVAGHNVVLLDLITQQQSFIAGSPNATEINFVTLSPQGRFLAFCERATPFAQVCVYELPSKRRSQVLPDPDMENLNIQCKEFLNCAFSPVNEASHMVTLSG